MSSKTGLVKSNPKNPKPKLKPKLKPKPKKPKTDPKSKQKKPDAESDFLGKLRSIYDTVRGTTPEASKFSSGLVVEFIKRLNQGEQITINPETRILLSERHVGVPEKDLIDMCLQRSRDIISQLTYDGLDIDSSMGGPVNYMITMAGQCLDVNQIVRLWKEQYDCTNIDIGEFINNVFEDKLSAIDLSVLSTGGGCIGKMDHAIKIFKDTIAEPDVLEALTSEDKTTGLLPALREVGVGIRKTRRGVGNRADQHPGAYLLQQTTNKRYIDNVQNGTNGIAIQSMVGYSDSIMQQLLSILNKGAKSKPPFGTTCKYVLYKPGDSEQTPEDEKVKEWYDNLRDMKNVLDVGIENDKSYEDNKSTFTTFLEHYLKIFEILPDPEYQFIQNIKRDGATLPGYTSAEGQSKRSEESTLIFQIHLLCNSNSLTLNDLTPEPNKIKLLFDALEGNYVEDYCGRELFEQLTPDEKTGLQRMIGDRAKIVASFEGKDDSLYVGRIEYGEGDAQGSVVPEHYCIVCCCEKKSELIPLGINMGRICKYLSNAAPNWKKLPISSLIDGKLKTIMLQTTLFGGETFEFFQIKKLDDGEELLHFKAASFNAAWNSIRPRGAKGQHKGIELAKVSELIEKIKKTKKAPTDSNQEATDMLLIQSVSYPAFLTASLSLKKYITTTGDTLIKVLKDGMKDYEGDSYDIMVLLSRVSNTIQMLSKSMNLRPVFLTYAADNSKASYSCEEIIRTYLSQHIRSHANNLTRDKVASGTIKLLRVSNIDFKTVDGDAIKGLLGEGENTIDFKNLIRVFGSIFNLISIVGGHTDIFGGVTFTELVNLISSELLQEVLNGNENIKHLLFV